MGKRGEDSVYPRRLDTNVAGAEGELTVNVKGTKAFVHDGKTPGGVPLVDALGSGLKRVNGVSILNKRPLRVIGMGDSIMQGSSTAQDSGMHNGSVIPPNWNDGAGIFEQTLWKANGTAGAFAQYMFVANMGIAGQTTTQVLARFQTDVVDQQPDVCILIVGTNDILSGMTEAQIKPLMNNIEQMVLQCIDAGIQVFLCTPPCKDEAAPETQAVQPYYYDLARYYSIPLLDINRIVVNPANGTYKASYSDDGVHPGPVACDLISTEFAKALANPEQYINRPFLAACSTITPGIQSNLCLNGNFAQGDSTDTPPNPLAWTSDQSDPDGAGSGVANTAAWTVDAALPFTGKKFVYTVPATGKDQAYAMYSTDINSGFVPGDVLEFAASYKQSGFVPATSIGGTFQLSFNGPFGNTARPINLLPVNADMVVSQECYVPQGCDTINVQLYTQDKNIVYTVQNVTLTNRSYRQRVWQAGQQ
jgi:lysophospholipase L1-like esterase